MIDKDETRDPESTIERVIASSATDGEHHVMSVGTCYSAEKNAFEIDLNQSNNTCIAELLIGLSVMGTHVEQVYRHVEIEGAKQIESEGVRRAKTLVAQSRAELLSACNSMLRQLIDLSGGVEEDTSSEGPNPEVH